MPKRTDAYMLAQQTRIIDAVLDTILERGLRFASIRDICKAANVSVSVFYNHFKSKDEAIEAAIERGVEQFGMPQPSLSLDEFLQSIDAILLQIQEPTFRKRLAIAFQLASDSVIHEKNQYNIDQMIDGTEKWVLQSIKNITKKHSKNLDEVHALARQILYILNGAVYVFAFHPSTSSLQMRSDVLRVVRILLAN